MRDHIGYRSKTWLSTCRATSLLTVFSKAKYVRHLKEEFHVYYIIYFMLATEYAVKIFCMSFRCKNAI